MGGGLSALLLLAALEGALPARVAVVDPSPPLEQPPVHWSYWSRRPTPYDRFAVGAWRRARVADAPPQPIAPYTMRLVRSTDVLAGLEARLEAAPVDRLRTTARSITHRSDGSYEVATDEAVLRAGWVFDSACGVAPVFRTRALLSGTGLRVEADRPVFDPAVATLFDPLDEESFAYALPLSPTEALVESASFGSTVRGGLDRGLLLRYLREGHPGASFAVAHEEYGEIPLGFAPGGPPAPATYCWAPSAGSSSQARATAWSASRRRASDSRTSGGRGGAFRSAGVPSRAGDCSTRASCASPPTTPESP